MIIQKAQKISRKKFRTEADTERSLVNARRRLALEKAALSDFSGDEDIAAGYYSMATKVA